MTFTLIRAGLVLAVAAGLSACSLLDRGHAAPKEDDARAPISLVEAMAEVAPSAAWGEGVYGGSTEPKGASLETRSVLYALHLASYRTTQTAEAGWRIISAEAPSALEGLSPRIERVDLGGERGEYLRLKAGPVESRAEATSRCAMLTAAGYYCRATDYAGADLAGG